MITSNININPLRLDPLQYISNFILTVFIKFVEDNMIH
ncbi:hypothetical protein CHCC20441_1583 [Bacillus licheniformis]|nr:hypothetical protein SC10_B2orf04110 [Bacillus paralicheniformis]OLF91878.1 hypothetical protein B4094_2655 [Bacillus licheniformis]OLF91127.1 hypothetical protein B4121_2605 [Bacillus paralicheniformis]OLF94175.1 hypothetical protein B4089_1418 [Bacillus licheniformis]OLG08135.1 hypothetical protein B4125_2316 [Bacillus paralicheniformis]